MKRSLLTAILGLALAAAAGLGFAGPATAAIHGGIGTGSSNCYECGAESTSETTPSSSFSCRQGKTNGMQWCEVYYPPDSNDCSKNPGSGTMGTVILIW